MPTWDVRFDLHVELRDESLIRDIARGEALAQIVRGIPLPPTVYERIDRLNISRAVRGTTGIEGAALSEEEVGLVLSTPHTILGAARSREEKEARNAGAVMDFVEETLAKDPHQSLSEALVCEIHRLTTEGIDCGNNIPGFYRSHAVHALEYVPPQSAEQVRALMRDFIYWLNEGPSRAWPPIVRAIAAHFYFISVHPFGDGNGRTARAIESYLLYQARINVVGFYSLSNFYYRNRSDYVEMLDYVRFQSGGDLTPFIKFAVRGLVEELEAVREEVLRALTEIVFFDYARAVLSAEKRGGGGASQRRLFFLQHLHEPLSVQELKAGRSFLSPLYRNLSSKTIDRDLQFLENENLIVRRGGIVMVNLEVMTQFTR